MSTTDQTPAQKQKQFRADQAAKGLKAKQLWMPEDKVSEVEAFVATLMADHEGGIESGNSDVAYQALRSQMVRKAIAVVDATLVGFAAMQEGDGDYVDNDAAAETEEEATDDKSLFADEQEEEEDDLDDMM